MRAPLDAHHTTNPTRLLSHTGLHTPVLHCTAPYCTALTCVKVGLFVPLAAHDAGGQAPVHIALLPVLGPLDQRLPGSEGRRWERVNKPVCEIENWEKKS